MPDVLDELETDADGLTAAEARSRLSRFGANQLALKSSPLWRIIIEPFRSVFMAILILAAVVSMFNHEQFEAIVIGVIIGLNAVIFYSQHYATEGVLRSLKKHSLQQVRVRRAGDIKRLASTQLVPGDIILLNEGERVPADSRVIHLDHLQIDESSLTGESVPVNKHSATLSTEKPIYEQDNMLFQGTYVVAGSVEAIVVETGSRTEYGKIASLASQVDDKSPVQTKIDHVITLLTKIIGIAAGLVFILALWRGIAAPEALRFVLSMTVSAVPEGLPVALTVIMVLGMRRMAKYHALVHSFKTMEDVGLVTTIATDKTGTLTKNHLEVVDTWSADDTNVREFAAKTIDGHDEVDPLDQALSQFVGSHRAGQPDRYYDFNIKLRLSGAYRQRSGLIYIKGSPEHILNKSRLSAADRKTADSRLFEFAARGYRVIALAEYPSQVAPKDLSVIGPADLKFIGFVAFADELRPEAANAIAAAKAAGVSVRMITGDHYETAYTIGKQLGLADSHEQVILGADLPRQPAALAAAVQSKTVFARILPEDKFRILEALKTNNIIAMTGDGVNDVPALANAHVGIAMGSGSDIAKDAGGMVLLNDNFATIIKALSEGRKIYDNIRRILFYLLATSLGEVTTMIGALLFNLPLPLVAIQILWINLVTDSVLVLPLGLEHEEKGHMKRPPRQPDEPLLSRVLLTRVFLVGLTMATISLLTIHLLQGQGHDTPYIQTVVFMGLIVAQWANALNARSQRTSLFGRLKPNLGLLIGLVIAISLQALAMFGPLRQVVHAQAVPLATLGIVSVVNAGAVIGIVELHKLIRAIRRRQQDQA